MRGWWGVGNNLFSTLAGGIAVLVAVIVGGQNGRAILANLQRGKGDAKVVCVHGVALRVHGRVHVAAWLHTHCLEQVLAVLPSNKVEVAKDVIVNDGL